jgi:subtilisin family serine protease
MKRALYSLAASLSLAACHDAVSPTPERSSPPDLAQSGTTVPNQYIIVLNDRAPDAVVSAPQLVATQGGRLGYTYRNALKGFSAQLTEAAAAALAKHPSVRYVEQDQLMYAITEQPGATWGIDRVDQRDLPLSTTYVYNATGNGVNGYILDTGIRYSHSDFGGRAVFGYDVIGDGRNGNDCHGHGTHVAGTVGSTTYGVAKALRLFAVRVLGCTGSGTTAGVIAGVDWVTTNHVKPAVANMSLGGGASNALDEAVRNSVAAGVTYSVAAGNSSANACNTSPARAAEALTIGATDSYDQEAWFSNYGTCVDLLAPGVAVTSAWHTSDGATNTISGTSMAAPHVAGAAALVLEGDPTASPPQVEQALEGNASANTITLYSGAYGTPNLFVYTAFIAGDPPPPPPDPPSAPTNLVATASGSSQINLAWTDNATNDTGFNIERCQGTGCTDFAEIATVGADVTSFSNTGLAASTSYSYQVRARNGGGFSDYSNVASATTAAPPPNTAPVARWTWSCNDRNCNFNGTSSTDDKGVTAYSWSLGDGSTASGPTVSKRYQQRGTYNVTLTVRDAEGLSDGSTCPVTVPRNTTRSGTCGP